MFCKECGKQIDNNSRFCMYCGCSVGDNNTTPSYNSLREFDIRDGVLVKYNGRSQNIKVPSGVTKIQEDAFDELFKSIGKINSLTIPGSVKEVRILDTYVMSELFLEEGTQTVIFQCVHAWRANEVFRIKHIYIPSTIKYISPSLFLYSIIDIGDSPVSYVYSFPDNLHFLNGKNEYMERIFKWTKGRCIYCGGTDFKKKSLFSRGKICKNCGNDFLECSISGSSYSVLSIVFGDVK